MFNRIFSLISKEIKIYNPNFKLVFSKGKIGSINNNIYIYGDSSENENLVINMIKDNEEILSSLNEYTNNGKNDSFSDFIENNEENNGVNYTNFNFEYFYTYKGNDSSMFINKHTLKNKDIIYVTRNMGKNTETNNFIKNTKIVENE